MTLLLKASQYWLEANLQRPMGILPKSNQGKTVAPHLALIAVQLLFASWPIFGKIALRTMPAVALVGFRVGGATLALLMLGKLRGSFRPIKFGDWPLLIVCSLLGLVFNQWLYVKGLTLTTAINATLLSTTIPVSTLLVGVFIGSEAASLRRVIGILIAAAGVIYLIAPDRARFSSQTRIGDLLIVSNSLCYGSYIAISKNLVRKYGSFNVITWIFIIGCIATIPAGIVSLSKVQLSTIPLLVWLEILYIILLPTAAAYFLNAWALAHVPPSTVAVYIYLQPLIAFVLAPIILRETLSLRVIVASLLIFVGVLTVTRRFSTSARVTIDAAG